jgi:type I site-specific restriction-modification system R (restriction) subunit
VGFSGVCGAAQLGYVRESETGFICGTGAIRKKFLIQSRSFAELLEETLRRYWNRAIETAQVVEELIALAKEIREAGRRGEDLGLTEDETEFYDALETNDSAVQALGDENLRLRRYGDHVS